MVHNCMLSGTVNFIRDTLNNLGSTLIWDSEDVMNNLFELCQRNNVTTENEILEILSNIHNVNSIKEIDNTYHNLLTCYISNNDTPSINVIEELIQLGIDLKYITNGQRNADAIMYYTLKHKTRFKIIKLLSHDNLANSYYSIYERHKMHNLITAYLVNNHNPRERVINYFESHCVSLTFICPNEHKINHNALSIGLNNTTVPTTIIKKLASNEVLCNHTLHDVDGFYNILTYYVSKAQIIHLDILEILLAAGCNPIFGNRFDSYKNNALLIYLHRADMICINVIDLLMNKKYSGCVLPNTVIYTDGRVYNILTWYVKYVNDLRIEIIDHLVSKGVNLHFIDNRSNNIAEISVQRENINIELLSYFYKKNIEMTEYCLVYYLKSRIPENYQDCIINYLFEHCKLYYHDNWDYIDTNINNNTTCVVGDVKSILNTYKPDLEATKLMNVTSKNYFKLYCITS